MKMLEIINQQLKPKPQKKKIKHKNTYGFKSIKALRYEKFDTLKQQAIDGQKYIIETDSKFVESIKIIAKSQESVFEQLKSLTNSNLTDKQCEEIHFMGKRHFDANKLNKNSGLTRNDIATNQTLTTYFCKCGCQKFKGEQYNICTRIQSIPILGSGIILYFYVLKMLIINLAVFSCIYSIFALTTNLLQNNPITDEKCKDSAYCNFRNNASDRSKFDDDDFNHIQQWLGVGGMFIVMILARSAKIIGVQKDKLVDKNLISSSDFALKFNLLPDGQYNEQDLLDYIQKLILEQKRHQCQQRAIQQLSTQINSAIVNILHRSYRNNNNNNRDQISQQQSSGQVQQLRKKKQYDQRLMQRIQSLLSNIVNRKGVRSIQIIYNMQFSRKLLSKLITGAHQIKYMMKQIHNKCYVKNKSVYEEKKSELINTYQLFQDLRKKFLSDPLFRKKLSTKFAIVQFFYEEEKKYFLDKFGSENVIFYKYFRDHLIDKCCKNNNKRIFKGKIPEVISAPEPTDIIWINCQKRQSISRIILIYFLTFLIILVSLGIMVGLNFLKAYVLRIEASQIPNGFTKQSLATFINIITTVFMQIINALLWILLKYLLELQYNHTHTNKIISQMNKSAMAVCINIIALPIIVNVFINDYHYYGAEGLSSIVYDYHISAIAIGLLVKFLDPASLVVKLIINVKWLRNYFIKARYNKKRTDDMIQEEQMKRIYQFYQAPDFVIAEYYIFIITNVLHAFFFASLQPILIIFAFIEVFIFYWISKYRILSECRIPQLTQRLIFDFALYQLMMIPIFFGAGSLVNSYIADHFYPNRTIYILQASICMAFGLINYSNPGNLFGKIIEKSIKCCCYSFLDTQKTVKLNFQRVENYYKNSNSLTLLGFQKCLLGNVNKQDIQAQLDNYCSSHQRKQIQQISQESIYINERYDEKLRSQFQEDQVGQIYST